MPDRVVSAETVTTYRIEYDPPIEAGPDHTITTAVVTWRPSVGVVRLVHKGFASDGAPFTSELVDVDGRPDPGARILAALAATDTRRLTETGA